MIYLFSAIRYLNEEVNVLQIQKINHYFFLRLNYCKFQLGFIFSIKFCGEKVQSSQGKMAEGMQ